MITSDWIKTIIIISNSWLLWLASLPKNHPIKIKLHALRKGVFKTRWQYISIALIITLILALIFELIKPFPPTRLAVFFISFLVASIIVQSLLAYVMSIKQKSFCYSSPNM